MAEVRPFRGLRYNLDAVHDISRVLCPPYDVISPEMQRDLYERSPYNVIRLEFAATESGESSGDRYEASARTFAAWRRENVLTREPVPAIYVLEQTYTDHWGKRRSRHSLFVRTRLQDFSEGAVLPHEETKSAAKEDRLNLLLACRANFSPVMGLTRDPSGAVSSAIERAKQDEALFRVDDVNGEALALWRLEESESGLLQDALRPLPLYLADGHHRYETALRYRDMQREQSSSGSDADYVLMAVVSMEDPGLEILGYHRMVAGLDAGREGVLAQRLDEVCKLVNTLELPDDHRDAALLAANTLEQAGSQRVLGVVDQGGKRLRVLALREEVMQRLAREHASVPDLAQCDVWVLQQGILDPVGAGHPGGPELDFSHDEIELVRRVKQNEADMALLLRPLPLDIFERIVQQGIRLPPKSSYFAPKLPTGLVIYAFEE